MPGRVVTIGEGLGVLSTLHAESLDHARTLALGTGGAEGNVAIGLARLDVPVTWVGRVGDDGLGRRVVRELRAEGVEVRAIVDGDAKTGLLVKETGAAGRTAVTYYRGGSAGSRLSVQDVDAIRLDDADLVHVTGITAAISASACDAATALVERARVAGVRVSFDVNHREAIRPGARMRDTYRSLAQSCDILFASEDEAALVTGSAMDAGPDALATALAALGPTEVVVTLGDAGCAWLVDGKRGRMPAEPIRPVDTVGAGDAFVAAWLAARRDGDAPEARAALAVRAGAAQCLVPGDWEGLPRRRDLTAPMRADMVTR